MFFKTFFYRNTEQKDTLDDKILDEKKEEEVQTTSIEKEKVQTINETQKEIYRFIYKERYKEGYNQGYKDGCKDGFSEENKDLCENLLKIIKNIQKTPTKGDVSLFFLITALSSALFYNILDNNLDDGKKFLDTIAFISLQSFIGLFLSFLYF